MEYKAFILIEENKSLAGPFKYDPEPIILVLCASSFWQNYFKCALFQCLYLQTICEKQKIILGDLCFWASQSVLNHQKENKSVEKRK